MAEEKKTLLLVDGSGYLYRAFHALPDLRNKAGEPTGAIYGMVAMLRRLKDLGNRHGTGEHPLGAVVFDAPGPTFRDALYKDYKANRSAMPEDLAKQIPPIHEIVRALGWPLLMVEGIEADDVIGTLAARATAAGLRTLVASGDKDLAQLVDDDVTLIDTMSRDGGPPKVTDRAGVIAKFGVPPERIVDWLALVGDSVDNVPGVDKVGPKTAVKLIEQFGGLEGLIARADEVKGVVGENLRRAREWLATGRELVTIRTDCDLSAHAAEPLALSMQPENLSALRELFERYGLRSFLRDTEDRMTAGATDGGTVVGGRVYGARADRVEEGDDAAKAAAAALPREYECVVTQEALDAWMARIQAADLVSFDTETSSLDPMAAEIVGLSFAVEPGRAAYVPLAHANVDTQLDRDAVLAQLKPWLEDAGRAKVGQNLKYDAHVLQNHGIRLAGVAHDTLLQSYVWEPHRTHDMDSMASRHLDRRTVTYEQVAGKGASQIPFAQVPLEKATEYAAEDADVTLQLHRLLSPRIASSERLEFVYRQLELPVSSILQRMERHGVRVDAALLAAQSDELGRKMLDIEQRAYEAAGQPFNLGSPKQIGEILFERMQLPVVKRTASGAPSTDEDVLAKLADDYPLPRLLLDYRGMSKLKSTYTDKLPRMVNPRTGRVHTSYQQAVAVTGRLASSEPNLQNIPIRTAEGRRIREAFVAEPGHVLVSADYSQVELRIMAHLSDDPGLLSAFAGGEDVHRATAAEIFSMPLAEIGPDQRRVAKTINFGLIYGMSAFGLAQALSIERDAARLYIDRYFSRYPGVARYMEATRVQARQDGYVETVFGRRLWLPEINSPSGPRRQAAERAAINAPMQGTAADLIKLAMIAVQGWLDAEGLATKLILQVHDELILEVPEGELDKVKAALPGLMKGAATLKVPLLSEVGVGANWEQAH